MPDAGDSACPGRVWKPARRSGYTAVSARLYHGSDFAIVGRAGFSAGILVERVVIRETPTCATEITRDRA